jgi:hypothetical protein
MAKLSKNSIDLVQELIIKHTRTIELLAELQISLQAERHQYTVRLAYQEDLARIQDPNYARQEEILWILERRGDLEPVLIDRYSRIRSWLHIRSLTNVYFIHKPLK